MRLFVMLVGLLACALLPGEAMAADDQPCGKDMVCASDPESVANGIMLAGYRAKLETDKSGDPVIKSGANGYDYSVHFYGCKENKACDSLEFYIGFSDDGKNTLDLANRWNKNKRFIHMAVQDSGVLAVSYDVATIGGINPANFADIMAWWDTMLGEMRAFFAEDGDAGAPVK